MSSKKINPDKRLADKKITPKANILNNKLSIASREGREVIRPIGWFDCNFFSCIFNMTDWAADKHKIL